MTDPDVIYLEPKCCADPDIGRCWCEHDAFEHCEDGQKATKYVRADLAGFCEVAAMLERTAGLETTLKDVLALLDADMSDNAAERARAEIEGIPS
jgi:hypothetical protein